MSSRATQRRKWTVAVGIAAVLATLVGLSLRSRKREPVGAVASTSHQGPSASGETLPDLSTGERQLIPVGEGAVRGSPRSTSAPTAIHGAISGRVVADGTFEPIAAAELTFAQPGGALSVHSDKEGRFELHPSAPGTYTLAAARAQGFLPFGPEWGRSPISVSFVPGRRIDGLVLTLVPAPDVLVTIVDESTRPVPGATARILRGRDDETVLYPLKNRFTSDANGQFRFEAEEGAVIEVRHGMATGRGEVDAAVISRRALTITLEPTRDGATHSATLSGVVLDAAGHGVADALVSVGSASSAYPTVHGEAEGYRVLTDESGHFDLDGLVPGLYDVSARRLGAAPARRFDVRVPGEPLTLRLGTGARLHGIVRGGGEGGPVPAFALSLDWVRGPLEHQTAVETFFVDPGGRYAVEGLAPGEYIVRASAPGFAGGMTPLRVPEGASDIQADIVLERGGRVEGVVRQERSGVPIASASVTVEGVGGRTGLSAGQGVTSSAAGRFILEGVPVSGTSLVISAEGHNSRVLGGIRPTRELIVELSPQAPDAGQRMELLGIGAVLRGRGDALVIGEVLPRGGAAEAGLRPGDEIVTIDGRSVVALGMFAAVQAVRGPADTPVLLGVRARGGKGPVERTVFRRKVVTG